MATQTPNLNLVLPDYADKADVGVINDNFKKIDNFSGGGKVDEWLSDIQKKADESLAKINQDATSYLKSIQSEANESLQEIQTEATESLNEIENKAKNSLESIPDDYETLAADVSSLKDTKADAIMDTSARAGHHELHAQRGPLGVTLYGSTYQEGEGDPSPEKVRAIYGRPRAEVAASGANLARFGYNARSNNGVDFTINSDGSVTCVGTATMNAYITSTSLIKEWYPICDGVYTISGGKDGVRVYVVKKQLDGTTSTSSYSQNGNSVSFTLSNVYEFYIQITVGEGVTVNTTVYPMLNAGAVALPWTPNLATTADLPLLPAGSPLHGNGTVDDTVENWVTSGCDDKLTFDGSEDESWTAAGTNRPYAEFARAIPSGISGNAYTNYLVAKEITASGTNTDPCFFITSNKSLRVILPNDASGTEEAVRNYLSANPLTIYFRSSNYTPEKDLRVCRVVRKWKRFTLDGDSPLQADTERPGVYIYFMSGYDASVLPIVDGLTVKNPTTSNNGANNMNANECAFRSGTTDRFYIKMAEQTVDEVHAVFAAYPVTVWYALAASETYMTDPIPLRKPDTLNTEAVTVTGSGETAVEYPHTTKHYIDQKFDALAAALLS